MIRQSRAFKAAAAAMGGSPEVNEPEPSYSARLKEEREGPSAKKKSYRPVAAVDPRVGGEVTPIFSEKEAASLPINLGYSIIEE